MRKRLSYILFALPAFFACTSEEVKNEGSGVVSFSIGVETTKAEMTQEELLSTAVVKIYKADFSGKVREYVYSQMPSQIYLPSDEYRVDVQAGEIVKASASQASWEQKSYTGSQTFKITAGSSSDVQVVAKVCNVISKVTFDASVDEFFADGYTCKVSLNDDASLVYDASKNGADGFFIASGFEPSLNWTFSGTLVKDGSAFTKSGTISAVEGGKRYKLGLKYIEKDGTLSLDLLVDDSTNNIYDNIIFIPTSTGVSSTPSYEVWAGHFTAHADVDESQYDSQKVYFEVCAKGSDSWIRLSAEREAEGTYSAVISGLAPLTEYEYRLAVTSLESGEEEYMDASKTITTDVAAAIPNGSFETTSNAESSKYKSFYDPSSSDESLQSKWWDNGNSGSTMVGASSVICYPATDAFKDGSQSVCLQSRYVVVKFAAGNLFSGHFGELVGTSGGTVFFGRPFTARPTALRFWMKYTGGIINYANSNVPEDGKKGNYDKASVRIALGTWDFKKYGGDADSPVCVNTTDTSTFVDYSTDASTIAFAEKIVSSDSTNPATDWIQVTLPIEWKDETKRPTHIIISCASSMYGDYFAGYSESKLWLDGMELLYE